MLDQSPSRWIASKVTGPPVQSQEKFVIYKFLVFGDNSHARTLSNFDNFVHSHEGKESFFSTKSVLTLQESGNYKKVSKGNFFLI